MFMKKHSVCVWKRVMFCKIAAWIHVNVKAWTTSFFISTKVTCWDARLAVPPPSQTGTQWSHLTQNHSRRSIVFTWSEQVLILRYVSVFHYLCRWRFLPPTTPPLSFFNFGHIQYFIAVNSNDLSNNQPHHCDHLLKIGLPQERSPSTTISRAHRPLRCCLDTLVSYFVLVFSFGVRIPRFYCGDFSSHQQSLYWWFFSHTWIIFVVTIVPTDDKFDGDSFSTLIIFLANYLSTNDQTGGNYFLTYRSYQCASSFHRRIIRWWLFSYESLMVLPLLVDDHPDDDLCWLWLTSSTFVKLSFK